MIKPTPGRIVHYYPSGSDNMAVNDKEPLAAIIAFCTQHAGEVALRHLLDAQST